MGKEPENGGTVPTVVNYAISQIVSGGIARQGTAAAATVFMMAVPIIVFLVTQSNVVETMATSGLKE